MSARQCKEMFGLKQVKRRKFFKNADVLVSYLLKYFRSPLFTLITDFCYFSGKVNMKDILRGESHSGTFKCHFCLKKLEVHKSDPPLHFRPHFRPAKHPPKPLWNLYRVRQRSHRIPHLKTRSLNVFLYSIADESPQRKLILKSSAKGREKKFLLELFLHLISRLYRYTYCSLEVFLQRSNKHWLTLVVSI